MKISNYISVDKIFSFSVIKYRSVEADVRASYTAVAAFTKTTAHLSLVGDDDILFGENWNIPDIDVKTRCIITVVSLMSQGITDNSLVYHLQNAKAHGVTKNEIAAIVTHVAFYAGWPKAWAVFNLAKEVWEGDASAQPNKDASTDMPLTEGRGRYLKSQDEVAISDKDKFQNEIMFPIGEPNPYNKFFVGQSYLAEVSHEQVPIFNVTFEPGCRNNWHIHHATSGGGQLIICIGGCGWYQEFGKEAIELTPGKVINIPPEVKHWHGAASDSWMAHLAIEVAGENTSNEWCEPVSEEDYIKLAK